MYNDKELEKELFDEFSSRYAIKLFHYINKGFSSDKKYYLETFNNEKYILRVTNIDGFEKKKMEFEIVNKIYNLNINTSKPIEYGCCLNNRYVYQILS